MGYEDDEIKEINKRVLDRWNKDTLSSDALLYDVLCTQQERYEKIIKQVKFNGLHGRQGRLFTA